MPKGMAQRISENCTECDKLVAASKESQKIGEFLEWAESEGLVELHGGIEKMLAKFYGIDLNEVERERRAILVGLRYDHNIREKGKK